MEKYILANDYLHPYGGLFTAGTLLVPEPDFKPHPRGGRWFRFEGSEDYVLEKVAKAHPETFVYAGPPINKHTPKFFGLVGMPGRFSLN